MKKLLLILFLALSFAGVAHAQAYGQYDLKNLRSVRQTLEGEKYGFDLGYLDRIINDLRRHAGGYPTKFDSPQDKERATQDVRALVAMLDVLIDTPQPDLNIIRRAAYLNSIGHNLDIPGAAAKANDHFRKLLAINPNDPTGNFLYGMFLASSGSSEKAQPFLEKALSLGVLDAHYALGLNYLFLGDKGQALHHFEQYQRNNPNDSELSSLIDAIRSDRFELKSAPSVPR